MTEQQVRDFLAQFDEARRDFATWPKWMQDAAAERAATFPKPAPADALDAARYRWLRSRDVGAISAGGVFAGMTPDNVVLSGEDLDRAVDTARTGGVTVAPVAWVPIHPRNGPLWSMTTDKPDPERLPASYPLRPLVFADGTPGVTLPSEGRNHGC